MHVGLRLDSRVERGDWTLGLSEPPSKLDFEGCARLMRDVRDTGNNVILGRTGEWYLGQDRVFQSCSTFRSICQRVGVRDLEWMLRAYSVGS